MLSRVHLAAVHRGPSMLPAPSKTILPLRGTILRSELYTPTWRWSSEHKPSAGIRPLSMVARCSSVRGGTIQGSPAPPTRLRISHKMLRQDHVFVESEVALKRKASNCN